MKETREMDKRQPVKTGVVASTYPTGAAVKQWRTTTHDPFQGQRQTAYKLVQGIYLLFGFIDTLIAMRVVLRLLGANPSATFAERIYGMTNWLAAPFAGLFSSARVGGGVLEVNALVALIVYALLALMLGKVAWLVMGETRTGLIARRSYAQAHVD